MQDWGALLTSMIFPGLYNDGGQVESPVVIGQFITGKGADSYRSDGNFLFRNQHGRLCVIVKCNTACGPGRPWYRTEIGDVFRGEKRG